MYLCQFMDRVLIYTDFHRWHKFFWNHWMALGTGKTLQNVTPAREGHLCLNFRVSKLGHVWEFVWREWWASYWPVVSSYILILPNASQSFPVIGLAKGLNMHVYPIAVTKHMRIWFMKPASLQSAICPVVVLWHPLNYMFVFFPAVSAIPSHSQSIAWPRVWISEYTIYTHVTIQFGFNNLQYPCLVIAQWWPLTRLVCLRYPNHFQS